MPDDGATPPKLEAFYLPSSEGRRFCVLHEPAEPGAGEGAILYVHPFAEEMNKARRMAALQSRALAAAGWTVLQIDLAGCGDSEGDFGDASWQGWVADVREAAFWLGEHSGRTPWLWGLRTGSLVATAAAAALPSVPGLLFWQPVLSGRQFLQQFLRLKVAAQILGSAEAERVDTRELRERLSRGQGVEVAGYALSPALAEGLEAAEFSPVPGEASVAWLEVSGAVAGQLSPAVRTRVAQWQDAGHPVDARCVAGQAFWQTQEIAECPALIEATLAAVAGARQSARGPRPAMAGARP
ncbi:MAG TPA: hydrolase 2, exosortase A system-associated [Casimicrobiaceae bacterium]|nr:hydrolase 2, exosortase A system-associated [Casimicrobiaceae bacterium]